MMMTEAPWGSSPMPAVGFDLVRVRGFLPACSRDTGVRGNLGAPQQVWNCRAQDVAISRRSRR